MNRIRVFTGATTGTDLGMAFDLLGRASTDLSLSDEDREAILSAGNRILEVIYREPK